MKRNETFSRLFLRDHHNHVRDHVLSIIIGGSAIVLLFDLFPTTFRTTIVCFGFTSTKSASCLHVNRVIVIGFGVRYQFCNKIRAIFAAGRVVRQKANECMKICSAV